MAKRSGRNRTFFGSKKHIARQEREQRQRRLILIGSIVVISLAVILVGYGIIQYSIIQPNQPVAIVNSDEISTRDWQNQTQYYRFSVIRNIENTLQLISFLGDDPNTSATFLSQVQQLQGQLTPPEVAGELTLDEMIDDTLIRQEADRRGIVISGDEIEKDFKAAFGYYPDGTPAPTQTPGLLPTSTLSSLQQTLIPPTSTPTLDPTAEESPTNTPTASPEPTTPATPEPTATEFTLEGYQELFQDSLNSFEEAYNISPKIVENGLRYSIKSQLYREKLYQELTADVACVAPQVWARHILVDDEDTAMQVISRLSDGENFCDLASELSTDTSNKDKCGDLGWFGEGRMVTEFEEAAYDLEVGEISDPVETQFGFHVIQSLGNENRQLTSSECDQEKNAIFLDWLIETRETSEIEIKDYWADRSPTEPSVPIQIDYYIQQLIQSSLQPIPTSQP